MKTKKQKQKQTTHTQKKVWLYNLLSFDLFRQIVLKKVQAFISTQACTKTP